MHHDLVLEGPVVSLRPLAVTDAELLAEVSESGDLGFHTSPIPSDAATAAAVIGALLGDDTTRALAVIGADGGFRGMTAFYEFAARVPRVEIGHTQYAREFWGGPTNPATKLLLLTHAFDVWGCVRVALRCDAANLRSAGAIQRLGATPEGILRNHRRRHDGTVADTAYFALTDAEWPACRARLEDRLPPVS